MADEPKRVVKVRLNEKYYFMVVISCARSVGELCAEVDREARELYAEFRGGKVAILETEDGARLPYKYKVGELLQDENRIWAYSSDYKTSNKRKRKLSYHRVRESEGRHCGSKRKRKDIKSERESLTANGRNNLHSDGSLEKNCRDKIVAKFPDHDSDDNVSEDDDDDGEANSDANQCEHAASDAENNRLPNTAFPENTRDGKKHSQSSGGQSGVDNEEIDNDLGVDQIRRKLSFSESRQHKSSDATQVKHSEQLGRSNTSKQQSDKIRTNESKSQGKRTDAKQQEYNSELNHSKPTTSQDAHSKEQESTFLKVFLDDMRELENGKTDSEQYGGPEVGRKVCGVQGQGVEATSQKRKALENIAEESKRKAQIDSTSSEAILFASKSRSLFKKPEYCLPKRKQAIETSAAKVADWLHTSNVSPNIDETETRIEGVSTHVVGTKLTPVSQEEKATKWAARSRVDNEDDDDDDDNDGDYDGNYCSEGFDTYVDNNKVKRTSNTKQDSTVRSVGVDVSKSNERAFDCLKGKVYVEDVLARQKNDLTTATTTEAGRRESNKQFINAAQESQLPNTPPSSGHKGLDRSANRRLSVSSSGSVGAYPTQTCQVTIKKLPVSRENGKLKVVFDSAPLMLTPLYEPGKSSVNKDNELSEPEREVNPPSITRSLGSCITKNKQSEIENTTCQKRSRDERCYGEKRTFGTPRLTRPVNGNFLLTNTDSTCREEDSESFRSSIEVTGSSTTIINSDSDGSDEVVLKTRKPVPPTDEINEKAPHAAKETPRRAAQSKEKRIRSQIQDNVHRSVKRAGSNETVRKSFQKEQENRKNDLMSKKCLSPSKANESALASSKHEPFNAFLHEKRDGIVERERSRISEESHIDDLAKKNDKLASEIQDDDELSEEGHSTSFIRGTFETETEHEVSNKDEDNSTKRQETDKSHSELGEGVNTPRNELYNVHVSVDRACRDKEENSDHETKKKSLSKGQKTGKEKSLVPSTICETVETSKNRKGVSLRKGYSDTEETLRESSNSEKVRNPWQHNSKSTADWKGTELSENKNSDEVKQVCSGEENENGIIKKSPKKLKSKNVIQDNVEHLQGTNQDNSFAPVQGERNESAIAVNKISTKAGKSKNDHLHNGSQPNSGGKNTGEPVNQLSSGKRKKKHPSESHAKSKAANNDKSAVTERENVFNCVNERGASDEGSEPGIENGDVLGKDNLRTPKKLKDFLVQSKERSQKKSDDKVEPEPEPESDEAESDENMKGNERKCSSPLHLTPFKEGKEIVWMKERSRKRDTETRGLLYGDAVKRLVMSNSEPKSQLDKTKRLNVVSKSFARRTTPEKTSESGGKNSELYTESFDSSCKSAREEGDSMREPAVTNKKKSRKKHKKKTSPDQGKYSGRCRSPPQLGPLKEGRETDLVKEKTRQEDTEEGEPVPRSEKNKRLEAQETPVARSESPEKTTKGSGENGAFYMKFFDSGSKSAMEKKDSLEELAVPKKRKIKKNKKEKSPDEVENNGKCAPPLYLGPFKERKEMGFMKEKTKQGDTEQDAGLDMSSSEPVPQSEIRECLDAQKTPVTTSESPEKTTKSSVKNGEVYMKSFDSGCKSAMEKEDSVKKSTVPKKRKLKKNEREKSPDQGVSADSLTPRNTSKALLSLVDLGQEDSTEKKSRTTVNRKTLTSPRKTVNKLMRHFRQTPKGFCHTVKHGKLSSSSSSVHIWRKPRKYLKHNLQLKSMTAEEKDLVTNSVSVEQLLNDESFWDT